MRTRTPNTSDLSSALSASESPCVSIYLPTHRTYPDSQQDAIRYRNLIGRVEEQLAKTHPGPVAREVARRLHQLEGDPEVWGNTLDGLAVLASPGRLEAFALPRALPERAEVGESFHVKPLLRHVQSADRFHVLGVSRDRVALFHGNRHELTPLEVPGLPLTPSEAVGLAPDGSTSEFHRAAPGGLAQDRGDGSLVSHGEGSRKEQQPPDLQRFYRAVDRVVTDRVSEPSGLPLILAGIDDNLSEFRALTGNRFVNAESVSGDWTKWTLPEIRDKAWKVFEKRYLAQLAAIREDYGTAAARGRATADLGEVAKAAAVGRVGILLIDADRTIPGSVDMGSGELRPSGSADAGDMLDDLAEIGLRNGATVIVTPQANMPTTTGLAAIFRY